MFGFAIDFAHFTPFCTGYLVQYISFSRSTTAMYKNSRRSAKFGKIKLTVEIAQKFVQLSKSLIDTSNINYLERFMLNIACGECFSSTDLCNRCKFGC